MSDVLIGKEIGGAVILEFLGKGAMGEVYRAYDSKLNTSVAIKTLKKDLVDSPEVIARFRREAQGLHKLNSPYVIKVWGIGETEDIHFIKLEYIDGESLRDFLDENLPIAGETALIILYQIVKGLEAAHKKGIIHRDIKPENILINRKGRAKIADLGIAKFLESSTLTVDGAIMGTPWYLSPEQVEGGEVDSRTDIYSLGVMFFYMITGEYPFYGQTTQQLLYMRLRPRNNPPSPKSICEDIPSEVEHLTMKMMQKSRDQRYKNTTELKREIKRLLLNCIKISPEKTLNKLRKYEEEWQELLRESLEKGNLGDKDSFVPFATKLITNSSNFAQKLEGANLLKSVNYNISSLNEDVQIYYYLVMERYKALENYDTDKVFVCIDEIYDMYESEKPERQKRLMSWLKENLSYYLINKNRTVRRTCIRILKKLYPNDNKIWELFDELHSFEDGKRLAAIQKLDSYSFDNDYAVDLLRGCLWEEDTKAKKKIIQALIQKDKDFYEIWEESLELFNPDPSVKRRALGNILKLQKEQIEWLRPIVLDLVSDLNPMVIKDFFGKLDKQHQNSLRCMISMYFGRLLFDILTKSHREPETMQSLVIGFQSRANEEFGNLGPSKSVESENEVWKECWDHSEFLMDFSLEQWTSLAPSKQVEYAQAYQAWYAEQNGLQKDVEHVFEDVSFELVLIPPGRFFMGSPENEEGRKSGETQHIATVKRPVYVAKYPVTQRQWYKIMKSNPSHFQGDYLPVERVSWENAYSFCEKVGLRLLGEEQWEYACRAGTTTKNYWGDEAIEDYFWYQGNSDNKTREVGKKKCNPFGLYDMIGNVWEWCIDTYCNYSTKSTGNSAILANKGVSQMLKAVRPVKVQRGGSWFDNVASCRSASRSGLGAKYSNKILGFRVAKSIT